MLGPLITNGPHHVYPTVAAAEAVAAAMDDGEEFTFHVVADPLGTGKAIIEVHDIIDGFFIALV